MNRTLSEIWSFIKLNFKFLLVATVLLVMFLGGCFDRFAPQKPTIISDTTSKTQYVPQPIIINPPYVPQQNGSTVYMPIPGYNQPVTPGKDIATLTGQVMELNSKIENLAKDYYAIRHYSDSIQLKDTSGNRVGVVNLDQTVSENILKETRPSYQLTFPHTTTTITNTISKNQVFFGAGVQSPLSPMKFNEVDLGLLFKNKREDILGIGGTYNLPNAAPGIRISYYKLIKLRK